MAEWDLPFEESPPSPPGMDGAILAQGVTVRAALAPVPAELGMGGFAPCLILDFDLGFGQRNPPVVLICSDNVMSRVAMLVQDATLAAVRKARLARAQTEDG